VLLSFGLTFDLGTLSIIQISNADPKYGTGWSDWSEDKEQMRVKCIAAWLVARGYPPARYQWGQVWAAYDPKGGGGSGGVRFA
jgi:hypothetical protein